MARTFEALEKSRIQTHKKTKGKHLRFSDLPIETRHQFEKLKSHIILGNSSKRIKSILFSSYNHGEGTSTIVANFAESLAQDRKYRILTVDANTRTPSLHGIAGYDNPAKKLFFSDILTQQFSTLALPNPSLSSNMSLIPSGRIVYHPSQVFDHTQFVNFIDCTTNLFDLVIFDSSPIGKYYDSIVLASYVDGVILVVEAEKTSSNELKRVKEMLVDKNIPILGVILNRRKFRIPNFVFNSFLK